MKDIMRWTFRAALMLLIASSLAAQEAEPDRIATDSGELAIHFIGHGSLMLRHGDTVIHVDPWSRLADYGALPDADLVLITHAHRDHTDPAAIAAIRGPRTRIICNQEAAKETEGEEVMSNGESLTVGDVRIEAVPAYNLVHKRASGEPYHPKGRDNGYVLTIAGKRIYIAGDTENIQEMSELGDIDIAFLPMNLPYTMTPEMVAEAAGRIKPAILYPYHYGGSDTSQLVRLLADHPEIEVRIRKME